MAQAATSTIGEFLAWWLSELRAAIPGIFRRAISNERNVITLLASGAYGLANSAEGRTVAEGDARRIADACKTGGRERRSNVIRLPAASVLVRKHEIPNQALGRLRQILALELESATPFSADDATFDVVIPRNSANGHRQVLQVIVKNSIIEGVVADFHRHGLDVHAIDAVGAEGVNLLPENLRLKTGPRFRKELMLLFASFVAVYAACYYRQGSFISELEERRSQLEKETSAVREAAAAAGAAAANIEAMRKHQAEHPLALSTLASLTLTLDDGVWLTELSIAGPDISISGYAASAADVISALEASNEFEDASFTTAVFTDQPTNSERFSARFRTAGSEVGDAGENDRSR